MARQAREFIEAFWLWRHGHLTDDELVAFAESLPEATTEGVDVCAPEWLEFWALRIGDPGCRQYVRQAARSGWFPEALAFLLLDVTAMVGHRAS